MEILQIFQKKEIMEKDLATLPQQGQVAPNKAMSAYFTINRQGKLFLRIYLKGV